MDAIALLTLYTKGQRDFIDAELKNANFQGQILSGIDLQGANLNAANFQDSDLRGADFQDTILTDATFQGANLQGANFKRANLQGVSFQNVNLKRANLAYANLQGANLQGANLQGANCRGADLRVANDEGVKWPSKKNLHEATLPASIAPIKKTRSSRQSPTPSTTIVVSEAIEIRKIQENLERLDCTGEKLVNEEIKKLALQVYQLEQAGYFTSKSAKLAEEEIFKSIAQRQGQSRFRRQLLDAYDYRCAVTGCDIPQVLEAASIIRDSQNNDVTNGLLLRADIHTLFDLNLLAIDADEKIHIHPGLSKISFYLDYHEKYLKPRDNGFFPCKKALKERYDEWMNLWVRQIFQIGDLFKM